MKKRYITLLYVFLLFLTTNSCNIFNQNSDKILFIGNSYTANNNLPNLVEKLAKSGGHSVYADQVTKGGWKLEDHATSSDTLATIEEGWDFVVLQEQSVVPSVKSLRSKHMYPATRSLDEKIKTTEAKTIFYMTWGRRYGLSDAGFKTFGGMQKQLTVGYNAIAKELDATVAPVGLAWQNALKQDPDLVLWVSDNSHPNKKGSYLAACVFYATIYQESPEGLSYTAGLEDEEAKFLQTVAAQTVLK